MTKRHHPLAKCEECPLAELNSYVPSSPGTNRYAIVGKAPGFREVKDQLPLCGKPMHLLVQAIDNVGVAELGNATLTNAIACQPAPQTSASGKYKGPGRVPKAAIEACRPRLEAEIAEAHTVLAMGTEAVQAVTGTDETVTTMRLGPPVENTEGQKVVATWNPAYVMMNPRSLGELEADLAKVRQPAGSDWIEPTYEVPSTVDEALDALRRLMAVVRSGKYGGKIVFDLETAYPYRTLTGQAVIPKPRRIRCNGLAASPDHVVVIPEDLVSQPNVKHIQELTLASGRCIAMNGKFDLQVLSHLGWHGPRLAGDPMLAHYVLDPRSGTKRNLEALSRDYLGSPAWKWLSDLDKVRGKARKELRTVRGYQDVLQELHAPWKDVMPFAYFSAAIEAGTSVSQMRNEAGDRYDRLKDTYQAARKARDAVRRAEPGLREMFELVRGHGISYSEFMAVVNSNADDSIYDIAPAAALYQYNAYDVANTFRVTDILEAQIEERGQWDIYQFLCRISDTMAAAEERGMLWDPDRLNALKAELELAVSLSSAALVGYGVSNPNSTPQVKAALERVLGSTLDSTDKNNLNEIIEDGDSPDAADIAEHVNNYRKYKKLISTYVNSMRKFTCAETQRVHANFNITRTDTGRLSSSGPNLHNQPKIMQKIYLAKEGHTLVQADLSQAEFKVIAVESQDPEALKLYASAGGSLHDETARTFYPDYDSLEDEAKYYAKREAKTFNFGLPYGRTPGGVAHGMGVTIERAQELYDIFFGRFAGIREWQTSVKRQIDRGEYLSTPFGRRYYAAKPSARMSTGEVNSIYRSAMAFAPQSIASDITQWAAASLHDDGWPILVTVHDSILLEVPDDQVGYAGEALQKALADAGKEYTSQIPFLSDVEAGKHWAGDDFKPLET